MKKIPLVYDHHDDGTITLGEGSTFYPRVTMLNHTEKDFYTRNPYHAESGGFILWFGTYSPTFLHVYAYSVEDALDACIDWIVDHAPGLLCDDDVTQAYIEAISEGHTEEEAREIAEIDTISSGNCGNYLRSDDWGIVAERVSGRDLLSYVTRGEIVRGPVRSSGPVRS